jgi:hypothetical protein
MAREHKKNDNRRDSRADPDKEIPCPVLFSLTRLFLRSDLAFLFTPFGHFSPPPSAK